MRARALASLISALAQITANFFFGSFLDWRRFTLNQRARFSYIFIMALFGGTWIWGAVVQHDYEVHTPALDWVDKGFGRGWAFYILMQVNLYVLCFLLLLLLLLLTLPLETTADYEITELQCSGL